MNKLKIEWMLERSHNLSTDSHLLTELDNNGFHCVLIRTGSTFEDPWLVASKYATITKNIKFMIAVNPAMMQPVYCASKISTFQKIFGDRIIINFVSGASTVEQSMFNDSVSISERYNRTGEFAQIVKQLVVTGSINEFNGVFYKLKNVEIIKGNSFDIVFAGSSDNTINLANNYGNAHYYAMESSEQYKNNRNKITVDSAIKSTIIVEQNSADAWAFADYLISFTDNNQIESLKQDLSSHESENQKRQQALHNFSKNQLIVENNIWSGFGLLRGGGITAMVGDYHDIAALIEKFYKIGLNRLLIAGTPEMHFANNFINGVMPILKKKNII